MDKLRPLTKVNSSSGRPKREIDETNALVKVLGTAQDGGLPQIGCYCENCLRAREDLHFSRLVASLAILDLKERKFFLLDATPDIKIQLDMAFRRLALAQSGPRNAPDGVLLTHAHMGHYLGLAHFGMEALSTHNLPVYCSSRMGDFLAKNGPWSLLVQRKNISLCILPLEEKFRLTPQISVTAFQVPHRDEFSDTLGFRIAGKKKTLLYIPDITSWEAWGRSISNETEKSDIAILDGTFFSPKELPDRDLSQIGHPFIQTSMKALDKVTETKQPRVFFSHLNHTNPVVDPDGEARKTLEERGFKIANDGMEFFL
jgi:pyrroloquinoline quinone biosynthesis protein B